MRLPAWTMHARTWRRLSQGVVLMLFLVLFRFTEDAGDSAAWLVSQSNWFFRFDPLVAAAVTVTGAIVWQVILPALVVLVATLVLARWFCGWFCPLGTIIDLSARLLAPFSRFTHRLTDTPAIRAMTWVHRLRHGKYLVLVLTLAAAAVGLPLIGYVDPFALLTRGLALGADPLLVAGAESGSSWLLDHTPEWFSSNVSEPAYAFAKAHVLPTRTGAMHLAGVSLVLLGAVLMLELVQRRFWCRNLCPTGALIGLTARLSWLKRLPVKACANCRECSDTCRMAAFDQHLRFQPDACNLCMDCSGDCPKGIAHFQVVPPIGATKPRPAPAPLDLSRRAFLLTAAAGCAAPFVSGAIPALRRPERVPRLVLRPPGAAGSVNVRLVGVPAHVGATLPSTSPPPPEDAPLPRPFLERLEAVAPATAVATASAASQRDRDFLDRCVRCGECMKVCPTGALQAAGLVTGVGGVFAPRLDPVRGYCEYSCRLCAEVCPTHAIPLLPLADKQHLVMGQAIFDRERCLPHARHEECLCCEEHCPVPDKAIHLDQVAVLQADGSTKTIGLPYVMTERCIGCGICENKCPLEGERGIRVVSG